MFPSAKTPYLGACWYIKIIFMQINNIEKPINQVQNIHFFLFSKIVISVVIIAAKETNNQTGCTDHSLFSSLFVVKGFTAKNQVLAFQIKLSPKTKKIPNGIKDNVIEKNSISAQTLLFSDLLIVEKNKSIEMTTQMMIPTKWK